MKKKIIFLDIDGVLNSKAYFESIKENEIPAAEKRRKKYVRKQRFLPDTG